MRRDEIAIAGVVNENPFDHRTWSGSSRYFFSALKQKGVLVGAVSAQTPWYTEYFYKALSFHYDMDAWKFKYRINVGHYDKMTKTAKRRIKSGYQGKCSVIMQIGAWYDLTGVKNKSTVSYHDGNVAALMKSPYGFPRVSKKYIERVMRHEQTVYKNMNLIFPMSEWLADSFVKDFGVDPKKVHSVGAGVNLPYVGNSKGKDYSDKKVLFVGKDFRRKGGQTLLNAFKRVRKKHKNAELIIIGPVDNIDEDNVITLTPVNKMIKMDLDRLIKAYEEASIFVMPSLYEPFGIVFCEAMAHRLPCIGTNICAIPEIIQEGETGFLVSPNDEKQLAEAIITLLESPNLCKEMGEKGYERYQSRFRWNAVAEKIIGVIEDKL